MMPVKKGQNWLPMIFHDFFGNEWIERAKSVSTPAVNIIENIANNVICHAFNFVFILFLCLLSKINAVKNIFLIRI